MHLYSATINLFSKSNNQVEKTDLTAAEIILLRDIHGNTEKENQGGVAPVVNIKFLRDVPRTDEEERQRLFGIGELTSVTPYREKQFRKVFVSDYQPLPQYLPEFAPKKVEPAADIMD